MIKAECDRCGKQQATDGAEKARIILPAPFGAYVPRLPDGWKRVGIPADDERVQGERKELCEECVNALRAFFEGDGAVAGLLEPETLAQLQAENQLSQDTIKRPECLAGKHETDPDGEPGVCRYCGERWDRPNLTERARKLAAGERASCTCAGVGFGTEDCVAHHPNGLKTGTHLECHLTGTAGITGKCPGIYRRGLFREHMERWHGVKVAERSKPCPYCAEIASGIMELGPHIAKEHPGDWQAWIDGGQKAG